MKYASAREFHADIIIIKLSGNTPKKDYDENAFCVAFDKLIGYLNPDSNAKIVIASEFFKHPAESFLAQYALERDYPYRRLSDLGEDDAMKAIGLFEHSGVANHPGDAGMRAIADRIIECMESNNML